MAKSFKQAEAFPLVYAVVSNVSKDCKEFIDHKQISAMLRVCYPKYVSSAAEGSKLNPEHMAANMVAWFSQKFTLGTNEYQLKLERKKLGRSWAYRSVQLAAPASSRRDA